MKTLLNLHNLDKKNSEEIQNKVSCNKLLKPILIILLLLSVIMTSSCWPLFYGREGREGHGHPQEHHDDHHDNGHH